MLWPLGAVAVYSLSRAVQATAIPPLEPVKATDEIRNANHIFNAIHSSLRQWGSSTYHNGMSFFPALVPAGTQFYHGSPYDEPVQGLEWLAFEPEHAIIFARRMKRSDGHSLPRPGGITNQVDQFHLSIVRDRIKAPTAMNPGLDLNPSAESPAASRPEPPPRFESGWLHTYRTKEVTPLLYIDGMSAGKCEKGTLDSQDVLLLNASSKNRGAFWERERADRLCKMARERWNGKIKGFIRMEAGFEIIMCSFSESLDFVQSVRAGPFSPKGVDPDPEDKPFHWMTWEWIKFVTARYDGIGGGRVKLDYHNFVTAYSYDLDLFRADDTLPRLENLSVRSLNIVRGDIDTMIQSWDPARAFNESSTDWQSIADMVVERYGRMLKHLVSGTLTSEDLLHELELALRVFINSDVRDIAAEIDRCVAQFNPPNGDIWSSVAARSIWDVTRRICGTLFFVFDVNMPLSESLENLWALVHYLDWSGWKKCLECPFDEVCFIPIWPFGAAEDRENPQCRNASELSRRMGYWGSPRPRGVVAGTEEVWARAY